MCETIIASSVAAGGRLALDLCPTCRQVRLPALPEFANWRSIADYLAASGPLEVNVRHFACGTRDDPADDRTRGFSPAASCRGS